MNISHSFYLQAVDAFRGERSISGVHHLLQGKRSAQTIQDGHIYRALHLFGVFSGFSKERLEDMFVELQEGKYVENQNENSVVLTERGQQQITQIKQAYPSIIYIDGWAYKDVTVAFWRRFSLLIQCLSNLMKNHHSFIPVTKDKDTLQWIKRYLLQCPDIPALGTSLYEECHALLEQCTDTEAEIIVHRLSGKDYYGHTTEQIAGALNISIENCHLLLISSLHRIFALIKGSERNFPVISSLIHDLGASALTSSAKETNKYLQQGFGIADIAKIRNLKQNTIEDHLIEIAIAFPHFDIALFVSEEDQELIGQAIERASSVRLREIKAHLPGHIPYFKIRLVLAKRGENVDPARRAT